MVKKGKWKIVFSRPARKDADKLASSGLAKNAAKILDILEKNPFQNPPPFEKLTGDFAGCCSRRINIQHRVVYQILSETRTVRIYRMFTHYGD